MRALVVVESMFGNTLAVARAVVEGLSAGGVDGEVVPVTEAPSQVAPEVRLLVVGGPTHAFGLSREGTRADAVRQGGHPDGGADTGLREWLAALEPAEPGVASAAFDTRVRKRGVPGSAARGAEKRLARLGYAQGPTMSFWVDGVSGPLLDGELGRARAWGEELAGRVSTDR
jgi:hypothetical protein